VNDLGRDSSDSYCCSDRVYVLLDPQIRILIWGAGLFKKLVLLVETCYYVILILLFILASLQRPNQIMPH